MPEEPSELLDHKRYQRCSRTLDEAKEARLAELLGQMSRQCRLEGIQVLLAVFKLEHALDTVGCLVTDRECSWHAHLYGFRLHTAHALIWSGSLDGKCWSMVAMPLCRAAWSVRTALTLHAACACCGTSTPDKLFISVIWAPLRRAAQSLEPALFGLVLELQCASASKGHVLCPSRSSHFSMMRPKTRTPVIW